MAIIYPFFLKSILKINDNCMNNIPYPYFDPACVRYEVLRSIYIDGNGVDYSLKMYDITEYEYRKSLSLFNKYGVIGLIGIDSKEIIEDIPVEAERMIYILKQSRPHIPATKMVILMKGFMYEIPLSLMRHLYASYGWAQGTKNYQNVDFWSLNLKISKLCKLRSESKPCNSFIKKNDRVQNFLEIFRTIGTRGITNRYPGSRVSFKQHKSFFLSFGLLGLIDKDIPKFRNSKIGFVEEGNIVFSKIKKPNKDKSYFLSILESKKIHVDITCIIKIFIRWKVDKFQSQFTGDINRLIESDKLIAKPDFDELSQAASARLDNGFINFIKNLDSVPFAKPGIFLFLPYLNRLKIFEMAASLFDVDPDKGYSWFNLLIINLGRIFAGIPSIWKTCHTYELCLPIMAGLVALPCKDTLLNKLATITESQLVQLRQYLANVAKKNQLIKGKRIAFDFEMRDFTGDDADLKNIGKGYSPSRKACVPGFRPHLAWDVDTGVPISLEFRNGKARGTTTIKRYIQELITQSLGEQEIEHVYLDSEYTAEHVWKFITDDDEGLGADLTMCVRQNGRVKKYIKMFKKTKPTWVYYDDEHTYTEQTFEIPIQKSNKVLRCLLKRNEKKGKIRCFGSTLNGLNSKEILNEYRNRWKIECGIKDLVENYFLDKIPGIDPHRIDIHYFTVTLARILFEMLLKDYDDAKNTDKSKKGLGSLRPEFLVGANATLSRKDEKLIITWRDNYPDEQYQSLKKLFQTISHEASKGLPFLGGLKLAFELVPYRKPLKNRLKRNYLTIK